MMVELMEERDEQPLRWSVAGGAHRWQGLMRQGQKKVQWRLGRLAELG